MYRTALDRLILVYFCGNTCGMTVLDRRSIRPACVCTRFEALTAVLLRIEVVRDVMPCRLLVLYLENEDTAMVRNVGDCFTSRHGVTSQKT